MKTVQIKVLASDITDINNFYDSSKCPITKALKRAGIAGKHAGGRFIISLYISCKTIGEIIDYHSEVVRMIHGDIPLTDIIYNVQLKD